MPKLLVNGELLLYGDVGDPFGWGDGFTATDVADALAEHGDGPITVRVNSGGGIATEGMAIYSLLKTHPGKVTIAIDGIAASAASLIAMAGADRQIRQGATMMIHDPATITLGTEAAHRKAADKLDKLGDSYAGVYANNAGKAKPDVRAIMKAETWFTADEAVAQGFAHSTIEETPKEIAAFDYRIYARAPRDLPIRMRNNHQQPAAVLPTAPVADPAAQPAANGRSKESATMKDWAAAFYGAAEKIVDVTLTIAELNAIVLKHDKREAADAELATLVTTKKDAAAATARANENKAQKPWAVGFYASAGTSGLTIAKLNEIVAACDSLETAKDKLIDAMSAASGERPAANGGHITITADGRDKFVAGATRSLVAKAAYFSEGGKPAKDGERNEFSQYGLRELARMALEINGVKVTAIHDPMAMIAQAFAPVIMAGAMSTSDFTNILANVANKAMLKGYEESPETFQEWTGTGTLTDFKVAQRVDLGLFPSLAKIQEGAEYTYAKLSDRGVSIVLATYGKLFPITRQAIINDDLSAFTKIPAKMGSAARRTIGDLVYAILTANANLADGIPLFHASHANLQTGGGSVMTATSLDTLRTKMGTQKDPDNIKAGLNIRPFALVVPIALQGTANQIMTSQTEPGQSNPSVSNRVANMAKVVSDARLDAASTTAFYGAANPAQFDTIEVDYLNGVQAPTLEQMPGWKVDGVEMKVRMDAGVSVLDFRGLQKSAGA